MIEINKNIKFSYSQRPLLVAEISGNHSGNKSKFLQLIESACKNGADLIKIQTYEPRDITQKNLSFKISKGIWKNYQLWDLYKKACTPFTWHKDAFKIAKKHKKIIFSSPFSLRAVDFLEKLKVPLYKIASFEITDVKLIRYIASKNKPIILSTGMSNINEIKKALKEIYKFHKKVIILHCVSNYPTNLKDTNLSEINILKKKFKRNLIGLSDHTNNIFSSIASLALKPVLIEKHFKLYKKDITTDSDFSITPDELKQLKKIILDVYSSLNGKKKANQKVSKKLRRSIYSTKHIKKNEKISKNNIDTLRPYLGICASKYFKIIGRKVKKDIKPGTPINKNLLV